MPSIDSLIAKLQEDYAQFTFEESECFSWSPNKKTIYTDPVQRLDPDKGVVVNPDTHTDIHRNNINDEDSLTEYAKRKK